jgi:hypothetical protein
VDASYNIPRWAEVIAYHGRSSASALFGIVKLVPVEENRIDFMMPDPSADSPAYRAQNGFELAADELEEELQIKLKTGNIPRLDLYSPHGKGFYTIANNVEEDTLFVRTRDRLPYACATFIVGHSQE